MGPFEIVSRVGPVAYWLALPPKLVCVHNVFHVFQLHRYFPDPTHVLDWSVITEFRPGRRSGVICVDLDSEI